MQASCEQAELSMILNFTAFTMSSGEAPGQDSNPGWEILGQKHRPLDHCNVPHQSYMFIFLHKVLCFITLGLDKSIKEKERKKHI